MSVIDISKSSFDTALSLASSGKYFDAAAIFVKCDKYEAAINYVGCLSAMGEALQAINALTSTYIKYNEEYNILQDVYALGEVTEKLVTFVRKSFGVTKFNRSKNKLDADKSLVVNYEFVPDDSDELGLELDFYNDSMLWNEPQYNMNVYDVHSKLYREYLRFSLEKAFVECEDKEFRSYANKLLSLTDADDLDTIEAQLMLCFYLQKPSKASALYDKLVAFGDEVSSRALRVALVLLFEKNSSKKADVMRQLMKLSVPKLDEFSPADLCDMIYYAAKMGENDLAYQFAQKLYPLSDVSYNCLDLLRVCSCAFYNGKDADMARQAALKVKSVVPQDCFSNAMLDFVNFQSDGNCKQTMNIAGYEDRNYWVPVALQDFGVSRLIARMKETKKFGSDELSVLRYVLADTRLPLNETTEQRIQLIYFAVFTLTEFEYNYDELVNGFIKPMLLQTDTPAIIVSALIQCAWKSGCREKILVSCSEQFYSLDLSAIKTDNPLFLKALTLTAAFCKTDVTKIEQVYGEISQLFPDRLKNATEQQLVYLFVSVIDNKFLDEETKIEFSEEDKSLYYVYKQAKK